MLAEREDAIARSSQAAIGSTVPDLALHRHAMASARARGIPRQAAADDPGLHRLRRCLPGRDRELWPRDRRRRGGTWAGQLRRGSPSASTPATTPRRGMRSVRPRAGRSSDPNWHFRRGDVETTRRAHRRRRLQLLPSAGGFDHPAQVTVSTARARSTATSMAGRSTPPQIVEPLKDVVYGRDKPLFSLGGWPTG